MTIDEMLSLKPGDVIKAPSGVERTVIRVSVHKRDHGRARQGGGYSHVFVDVPIMACSWTKRCFTVLDKQMLRDYTLPHKKNHFRRTKLGREVERDTQDLKNIKVSCCTVVNGKFR